MGSLDGGCTRMNSTIDQSRGPRVDLPGARPEQFERSDIETLPFGKFVFGAGVECSILPHMDVDQFRWTQHDRCWRDDLKRAREELGLTHLRYAFPWHVLEPRRGEF